MSLDHVIIAMLMELLVHSLLVFTVVQLTEVLHLATEVIVHGITETGWDPNLQKSTHDWTGPSNHGFKHGQASKAFEALRGPCR